MHVSHQHRMLATVLIVGGTLLLLGGCASRAGKAASSLPLEPTQPSCPASGPVTDPVTIQTEAETATFTDHCYFAPAGTTFGMVFGDNLVPVNSGPPTTLSLFLFPSRASALSTSSSGVVTFDGSHAVVSSPPVVAPNKADFEVPPLDAGRYFLTTDQGMEATLVVEKP